MKRLTYIPRFLVLALSLVTVACSAKLEVAPGFSDTYARSIAVLPLEHPDGISRERLALIRKTIENELQNSGFVTLEPRLVDQICPDARCANRSELVKRFGVDGFVEPTVKSVDHYNFLAGYYNSIDGGLRFLNAEDKQLFSITHRESERGGLVFDSGQVIEGLKSQVKSGSEETFSKLTEKFVETLVAKVPKNQARKEVQSAAQVNFDSIAVRPVGASAVQVCAKGTTGLRGYVIVRSTRSTLRETQPGQYCGIYLSESLTTSGHPVQVELRTPFGVSAQKTVQL